MSTQNAYTGIAVNAKYFVLNFLCVLFPLVVEINGQQYQGSWSGQSFFPTAPGDYQVTIYWKYLWFLPCNKATTMVRVQPGQVSYIAYDAPWFFLLPGKVFVTQAPTQAAA
jgi:hypothetical protein